MTPPLIAVQLVAMLALDPPAHIAQATRARLTAGGLDDAAIDQLVAQARGILRAPRGAR
jgi:hypothetical protein